MNSLVEELKENGYKYVEMKEEEYPIWGLWDSPETIYIKGMLYKDLLEDSIYFEGIRYETFFDKIEDVLIADEYENSVLEVFIHEDENDLEETLEMASKLQEKINNGYSPNVRDVLGEFVGAETPYEFVEEGTKTKSFKCEGIVEYLEEFKLNK